MSELAEQHSRCEAVRLHVNRTPPTSVVTDQREAGQVGGAHVAGDRGEPDERRRAEPGLAEDVGPG